MSIETRVLKTVLQHNMISQGDRVLAAVSGGADSVCMLYILNRLCPLIGAELFCAHLNHGLRGDDADSDERFVIDLCGSLGIDCYTKKVDVKSLAKETKQTTEEAGRQARYDFFREISDAKGCSKIATAHNKNDNAETVLMRILRGTGIDGLSGIPYTRTDGVIRPLLDISRDDIEKYCKENGYNFCTDATNFEDDYTRNKIRNQLLPYLEEEFNSKILDSLTRLSETAGEDKKFLNDYATRLYKRLGNPLPSGKPIVLHIDSLKMLEKAIALRVIRLAAADAVSGITLEKKHMDDILELMNKDTGTSINLPKGLRVSASYGWLTFEGKESTQAVKTAEDGFFSKISVGETVFLESVAKEISLREDLAKYKCSINEIVVDLDKIGNQPLFLRSRRDGDRIVWFPDGRSKKVKSIFIDQKIPKSDRDKIPLLCTGDEVIAIVGSRVSEKYKVTKDTERALVIRYGTVEEK